jgi:hypothetical protein
VPDLAGNSVTPADEDADVEQALVAAGIESASDSGALPLAMPRTELDRRLDDLPVIELRHEVVPPALRPEVLFATMVDRVLDNCPINFHEEARTRRATPSSMVR